MIPELDQAHVHIKNRKKVNEKLQLLFNGGVNSLQIITDYDMTLSRYAVGDQRCPSSHGVLEEVIPMTPEAKARRAAVSDRYRAIEIDPMMTVEEKIPYMLEWWGKAHEAMDNVAIKKSDIVKAVSLSRARLKDGCCEFFKFAHQHQIPLLIFSAGLGDVIEEVLRQKAKYYDNMKLISNFMKFDQEGCMDGFQNRLIHTFNKNEGAMEHNAYFEEISHRHNIILLGDMMGDLNMANGVENINTLLTIGYLNKVTPKLLKEYMDAWDIVLTDDHTVDVLTTIVTNIVK